LALLDSDNIKKVDLTTLLHNLSGSIAVEGLNWVTDYSAREFNNRAEQGRQGHLGYQ